MVRTNVVASQMAPASPRGASIAALPDELLAAIFTLLSILDTQDCGTTLMVSVPRVCRQWRNVCKSPLCRVKLSLRPWLRSGQNPNQRADGGPATEYVPVTDASLARGLAGFGGVAGLMLFGCVRLTNTSLATIGRLCPKLDWLSLGACGKNLTELRHLADGCPALRWLEVTRLVDLAEADVAPLVRCEQLRHLVWHGLSAKTAKDHILPLLPRGCVVVRTGDLLTLRWRYLVSKRC